MPVIVLRTLPHSATRTTGAEAIVTSAAASCQQRPAQRAARAAWLTPRRYWGLHGQSGRRPGGVTWTQHCQDQDEPQRGRQIDAQAAERTRRRNVLQQGGCRPQLLYKGFDPPSGERHCARIIRGSSARLHHGPALRCGSPAHATASRRRSAHGGLGAAVRAGIAAVGGAPDAGALADLQAHPSLVVLPAGCPAA